jgi:uncharacterized iron-regulated protein
MRKALKKANTAAVLGPGAFRAEVVALHRAIFRANAARMRAAIAAPSAELQRYERSYARYVATYRRAATAQELVHAIADADAVFVGDYHTLLQAQRTFVAIMADMPPQRDVIVALEFVPAQHQRDVDAFLAGRIGAKRFLQRMGYAKRQGCGTWAGFAPIFELARQRGWPILALDSEGRGPCGLRRRDQRSARRIAAALTARPGACALVLAGQLHVAPSHLPRAVRAGVRALRPDYRDVVVFQNCEKIYTHLLQRGIEQNVGLVLIKPGIFCWLNTPPIVCQQSFLNTLSPHEDGAAVDDPTQTFKDYVQSIASFFRLPVGSAADEVELTTVADLNFLQRLARRKLFNSQEMRTIARQVRAAESYYIPRANMVYLGQLSVNHISEEATHFLRHVCAQVREPKLLVDAFYARCIEEALGFLGSKVINPQRSRPTVGYFAQTLRRGGAPVPQRALARLVLRHVRMEAGERVRGMAAVYNCDADTFNALTHILGYRLGDRMYAALATGRMRQETIQQLFFERFDTEGTALSTYLYLIVATRAPPSAQSMPQPGARKVRL